jgi:hypothetical protein
LPGFAVAGFENMVAANPSKARERMTAIFMGISWD